MCYIWQSSWPKVVAKKWLNMQSGAYEFHSDYSDYNKMERRRKSCSDDNRYVVVPEDFSGN